LRVSGACWGRPFGHGQKDRLRGGAEAERAQRGERRGGDERGDLAGARRAGVAVVGGVGGAHALAGVDLEVADDPRVVGVGGERGDGDGVADGEDLGRAVEVVVEVERAGVLAAAQLLEALAHGGGDALGGLAAGGRVLAVEGGLLAQRGEQPADGEQDRRQGDAEAERDDPRPHARAGHTAPRLELVAAAADGADPVVAAGDVAQLVAELEDVHVDGAGADAAVVVAPHVGEQGLAGDGDAGAGAQVVEDQALAGGQPELSSGPGDERRARSTVAGPTVKAAGAWAGGRGGAGGRARGRRARGCRTAWSRSRRRRRRCRRRCRPRRRGRSA
jgi:hypothetical protein